MRHALRHEIYFHAPQKEYESQKEYECKKSDAKIATISDSIDAQGLTSPIAKRKHIGLGTNHAVFRQACYIMCLL